MVAKKDKNNLVWVDLEMTGLDPEKEQIIEIATVITDSNLRILATGPNYVIHQNIKILKGMDEWNQKHHKKSGLIEEVKSSKITLKQAEYATLDFIKEYAFDKKSPLCGSSVHHDRRFLIKHMPKVDEYLHYRLVDVSTVKGLVAKWYSQDKKIFPKKKDAHRALPDILESIDELRFYKNNYFKE